MNIKSKKQSGNRSKLHEGMPRPGVMYAHFFKPFQCCRVLNYLQMTQKTDLDLHTVAESRGDSFLFICLKRAVKIHSKINISPVPPETFDKSLFIYYHNRLVMKKLKAVLKNYMTTRYTTVSTKNII